MSSDGSEQELAPNTVAAAEEVPNLCHRSQQQPLQQHESHSMSDALTTNCPKATGSRTATAAHTLQIRQSLLMISLEGCCSVYDQQHTWGPLIVAPGGLLSTIGGAGGAGCGWQVPMVLQEPWLALSWQLFETWTVMSTLACWTLYDSAWLHACIDKNGGMNNSAPAERFTQLQSLL
jgi:hypothetical protein